MADSTQVPTTDNGSNKQLQAVQPKNASAYNPGQVTPFQNQSQWPKSINNVKPGARNPVKRGK